MWTKEQLEALEQFEAEREAQKQLRKELVERWRKNNSPVSV